MDWDLTYLYSTVDVENKMWNDCQSSMSQGTSKDTFNGYGEFREINKQDMSYLDAL